MSQINDDWLALNLPKYELLGKYVTFILENLLQQNNIGYLSISYRTKTKEGVYEKIDRKSYKDPLNELMDFSGVRIILYFESDLDKVCNLVKKTFNIFSDHSVDNETRLSTDRIGYRSIHYVCDIGENRQDLVEYEYISSLKCEIQVRTMLQHAWAELTHDRNYKLSTKLPTSIQRKINLYSGMLELADQGFSEIISSIESYQIELSSQDLSSSITQPIDSLSIKEFAKQISNELGFRLKKPLLKYQEQHMVDLIEEIEYMEISSFQELKSLIPENYAEVRKSLEKNTTIYGFIRDLLIFKDFRKLYHKPGRRWTIAGFNDPDEYAQSIEYYENFMSREDAEELLRLF